MRPLPLPPPPLRRSGNLAIVAFLGLAATAAVLLAVVPKFADVYVQVKVRLPAMTEFLFDVSAALCAEPWFAALLLISLPGSLSRLNDRQAAVARLVVPAVLVGI